MTNTHINVGGHKITTNTIGTIHTITVATGWDSNTYGRYKVINGICQLWGRLSSSATASNKVVFTGIPKPASNHYGTLADDGGTYKGWLYLISTNNSSGQMSVWAQVSAPYFSIMYIVADDWVEPSN